MAKKILIIEDEQIITKSLQKLLKKNGYEVEIAHSGTAALAKVRDSDFDLIVCDVMMPQMDGIDTIKTIRAYYSQQQKPPVPEIIITGYADESKYKSAVDLKVSAYLYKPFDTDEFITAIENALRK